MILSGARVLVTGAGGFIGSHLAERLIVRKRENLARYEADIYNV
jgi:nucleoside-diphosphate-sugar epimerase